MAKAHPPELRAKGLALLHSGLAQRAVAEQLGVSRGTIQYWLNADTALASVERRTERTLKNLAACAEMASDISLSSLSQIEATLPEQTPHQAVGTFATLYDRGMAYAKPSGPQVVVDQRSQSLTALDSAGAGEVAEALEAMRARRSSGGDAID